LDIRINLLPERKKPYLTYILISLMTLILIMLSTLSVMEYVRLNQRSQELTDNIDRMKVMYESILQEWETASNHLSESNYLIYYDRLVAELSGFWYPPDKLMEQLYLYLPAGARIDSMNFNYNGAMNLLVRVSSKHLVADYLDRLDASPLVLSSELISINMAESGDVLAQINLRMVTTTGDTDG